MSTFCYHFHRCVRNYVKLEIPSFVMNFNSGGVFSKDTQLGGGYWLWAWQISWGLQVCITERSKVPNALINKLRATLGG